MLFPMNVLSTSAFGLRENAGNIPLFKAYPRLREQLPYVSLGQFPTPVEKLQQVGDEIGLASLYIKRDDLSGRTYGGNKVRKLEFLLGDALRANAKEVVTFGFAGSNHSLATTIYAGQLGLGTTAMLLPQANAHYVRRNLLASRSNNADLRHYENTFLLTCGFFWKCLESLMKRGALPRIIPAGGTCPLGVIGYLNALLELKEQIIAGELPEPDRIYVPFGSMGTTAGLMLGLKASGLRCQLVAVRVIEEPMSNARKIARLLRDTVAFLRKRDPTFPNLAFSENEMVIRNDCLGEGYARFTEKAVKAADLMKRKGGIILNGTYSAKAFSALVDDANRRVLKGKTILFWNTYNSRNLSAIASSVDYHQLPLGFHSYFEKDVQPLDQAGPDR